MTINMKPGKIIIAALLSVVILLLASRVQAQSEGAKATPEQRAKALSDKMKKQLPITDSTKYNNVYALNLKYALQMQQVMQGANGKLAKFRAAKAVQKDKSREMKEILTKDEYKKYEQMMEEMKAGAKEMFRNRNNEN